MQTPSSSGLGQPLISVKDRPPDHAVFQAATPQLQPSELPMLLSRAVDQWMERHPERRVRGTLAIVVGGNTVALHVWYDGRLAPARQM